MKAVLAEAAADELREAFAFYEQEQPGLGRRFLDEVEACRRRIERLPEAWHPLGEGLRRCRLRHFPYGLIYRVVADYIEIIAVAHLHRAPEYWRRRTEDRESPEGQ